VQSSEDLALLAFYSRYTLFEGGYSFGPRYLIPGIWLLGLTLGFVVKDGSVRLRRVALALVLAGAVVNLIGLATSPLEDMAGGRYYDVHRLSNMRHELTILAYEMNGAPVSVLHGAPLRLRCENELGFKMVKWVAAIELVHDFADLGAGQGGYNEDHEFYGYRMPI